jgi:hypothetical protein
MMFGLPGNQVPAGARNPPTRDAREARSFKANGLCGASLNDSKKLAWNDQASAPC